MGRGVLNRANGGSASAAMACRTSRLCEIDSSPVVQERGAALIAVASFCAAAHE
jgi:hypothetical protein